MRARAQAEYHISRIRFQETRAARRARATICVSPADATHFANLGARRIVMAPNGVDRDLFELPISGEDSDSVLFFGQISWPPNYDGLDRFLRIGWPRVRAELPNVRLRVAGPGVKEALRERGALEAGVDVVGLVDDITTELQRARIVVVPIWAGGGTRLKVLEAMASGRTVVGTTLGVAGIGFIDGEHGLLAEDSIGLAARLVEVLNDRGLARRLGEAARAHVRAFEWTKATATAGRLYAELVEEHSRASPVRRTSRGDGV
jgi:glycosyltransferase involved in cell wall biosynthesis